MWQRLMDWLPDWPVVRDFLGYFLPDLDRRQTYEVVRDVLSVLLAFIGTILAGLAIHLAWQQRKEEKQRRSRKAKLSFELFPKNMDSVSKEILYDVYVHNAGDAKADGYSYSFMLPSAHMTRFNFNPRESRQATVSTINFVSYQHYFGFVEKPLFKSKRTLFASLLVKIDGATDLVVRWQLSSDDGEWPDIDKFGELNLLDPATHTKTFVSHNPKTV